MANIISFINMKGGVGKTTISCMVSDFLASEFGNKTLLIDLDPQTNATLYFLREDQWIEKMQNEETINTLFLDYINKTNKFNFDKVLVKNISKHRDQWGTLDLIPSTPSLGLTQELLYKYLDKPEGRESPEYILKNRLLKNLNNYRYVIIDAPPNLGIITRNGLNISNFYIIPVIPDYLSTYGIDQLINELKNTHKINTPLLGIIISKYRPNVNSHKKYITKLQAEEKTKGFHLFNSYIRETVKAEDAAEAHDFGKKYTKGQLYGHGSLSEDIKKLTEEIIKEVEKYE